MINALRTTDVMVVGAGPVGLLVAGELTLRGVSVTVLERLDEPARFSKAFGLNARSTESVALRGLVPRLRERAATSPVAQFGGRPAPSTGLPVTHFAGIRTVRLDRLDIAYPGMLGIQQSDVEAVLEERALELGVRLLRGRTVSALEADDDAVRLTVTGPGGDEQWTCDWLVGCDGGRSTVRRAAGFGFEGTDPTMTGRLAQAVVPELMEDPGPGWHRTADGIIQVLPGRVITVEFDGPPADRSTEVDEAEMAASVSRVVGRSVDLGHPDWLTRFTDNARRATSYRHGRVLLAGDAAHVHSPFGGQGMNLGVQDAMALGWRLAGVVHGWTSTDALDHYSAERGAVADAVLHNTRAQVALMNPDPVVTPLRETFAEMMQLDQVNLRLAEMLSGVAVRYPADDPADGGFVHDRELLVDGEPVHVLDLFADGRAVLLDLRSDGPEPTVPADRVRVVRAESSAPVGDRPLVLVRPDGYVAWSGDSASAAEAAVHRWFGAHEEAVAARV